MPRLLRPLPGASIVSKSLNRAITSRLSIPRRAGWRYCRHDLNGSRIGCR
jgi:hypothetical protein